MLYIKIRAYVHIQMTVPRHIHICTLVKIRIYSSPRRLYIIFNTVQNYTVWFFFLGNTPRRRRREQCLTVITCIYTYKNIILYTCTIYRRGDLLSMHDIFLTLYNVICTWIYYFYYPRDFFFFFCLSVFFYWCSNHANFNIIFWKRSLGSAECVK